MTNQPECDTVKTSSLLCACCGFSVASAYTSGSPRVFARCGSCGALLDPKDAERLAAGVSVFFRGQDGKIKNARYSEGVRTAPVGASIAVFDAEQRVLGAYPAEKVFQIIDLN